jgi:hypothetical protein
VNGANRGVHATAAHKLVIHESQEGKPTLELFDLVSDPAEKNDLFERQPELVRKLQGELRDWQQSVLRSLTGADYR